MFLLLGFLSAAPAVDWYVATNGTGLGINGWADATNSLQGAINNPSVTNGVTIWVSNGVYDAGGITNYPTGSILTNRLAIWKSIMVRSKDNDPVNTVIKGNWDPATNGPSSVRCVYMTNNSTLIGFTITNGATSTSGSYNIAGGGIYCPGTTTPAISNCIITGNAARGAYLTDYGGGGVWYGTLYNCRLIGNRATSVESPPYASGGGATYSILSNCTVIGNTSARNGGGLSLCTLYSCAVSSNSCKYFGGGVYVSTVKNCVINGNYATQEGGGGLFNCALVVNSKIINNSSPFAGGAYAGSLYNCLLAYNSANDDGGGTQASVLYNCTVVSNRLLYGRGGGVNGGSMSNCIVYYNSCSTANQSNWYGGTFVFSCTAPTTTTWTAGDITSDPMFINKNGGDFHLSPNSPCVNAGTNGSWITAYPHDLDGRARVKYGTVDMGAYEHIRAGFIYTVY